MFESPSLWVFLIPQNLRIPNFGGFWFLAESEKLKTAQSPHFAVSENQWCLTACRAFIISQIRGFPNICVLENCPLLGFLTLQNLKIPRFGGFGLCSIWEMPNHAIRALCSFWKSIMLSRLWGSYNLANPRIPRHWRFWEFPSLGVSDFAEFENRLTAQSPHSAVSENQ